MGVEKQKGFRVEYCHVNDEYVAMIKDTPYMGVGPSIDDAVTQLEADVNRGESAEGVEGETVEAAVGAPAEAASAEAESDTESADDFTAVDHVSFGGGDDDEDEQTEEDEQS